MISISRGQYRLLYNEKKMYKDSKGLYRQSVTIDGKRKVVSAKTKKDLFLKLALLNESIRHTPLFRDIADLWGEQTQEKLSHGSWRSYSAPLREVTERFGDKEISSITPNEIQRYLNNLDLSYKSTMTRKSILTQIFNLAIVEFNLDIRNPCDYVKVDTRKPRSKRQALTPEEINAIKSTTKDELLIAPVILYTGCRCGEVLALTYGDVDFEKKVIHINKSIDHYGNKPVISTTKTAAGIRDVPLLPQLEKLLSKGKAKSLYIVSGEKPLTKSALTKRWEKWEKEHNVNIDRHQIRHAYASILYQSGVDPKSAQLILGHANFSTTMDIYTHLSQDHISLALDKLKDF